MINIVKDGNIKYVTKGAYENFYKCLGYNILGKEEKKDISKTLDIDLEKYKDTKVKTGSAKKER